jgi:hypothetical protein
MDFRRPNHDQNVSVNECARTQPPTPADAAMAKAKQYGIWDPRAIDFTKILQTGND